MTKEEYKDLMCENCKHNCSKCKKEKIEEKTLEDGVTSWKCLSYERNEQFEN